MQNKSRHSGTGNELDWLDKPLAASRPAKGDINSRSMRNKKKMSRY